MTFLSTLSTLEALHHHPERLSDIESWHRHIPFAFALIHWLHPQVFVELGTHKGDSYCAFCQAVTQQGLDTRCYAVDTWAGDSHAGGYGSDVLDELSRWHDPRYSSFSSLLRMTFDDALSQFSDGSIDLLHIDGLHTYEAVKKDFDSWLPRLSERAVVLFHDTNVRHGDFGVWKLWEELSVEYPAFEFPFGFGLGVLVVGKQAPQQVLDFIAYAQENSRLVVDFFYRLGDAAEVRKRSGQIVALQQRNEGLSRQLSQALERAQNVEQESVRLHARLMTLEQVTAEQQAVSSSAIAEVESLLQRVLQSRGWRLRNSLMRMFGRSDRVIE